MDFAGNIKRCDADRVPCPGSHECIGHGMESVCCLKPERICQASLNAGTSCGGPPQTRYFYDAPSRVCRPFTYTGCGGNENNFKTKGECIHFCNAEIICLRGDPHPDRYSINKIATCTEDSQCSRNYTCTRQADLRKGACCPSRDFVCGSPLAERSNRRFISKEMTWTFDYRTGDCEMKEYIPGDEQWNSFASQEQCIDFCVGTCPNHLEVHYNPVTGQPQLCDARAKTGCPMGFECVKTKACNVADTSFRSPFAAICCRTKAICPAAESIALLKEHFLRVVMAYASYLVKRETFMVSGFLLKLHLMKIKRRNERKPGHAKANREQREGSTSAVLNRWNVPMECNHCVNMISTLFAVVSNGKFENRSRFGLNCGLEKIKIVVVLAPAQLELMEIVQAIMHVCLELVGVARRRTIGELCYTGKMPNGEDRHLCCKPQKKCIVPFVDLDEKRPKRCFPVIFEKTFSIEILQGDLSCPSATACLPVIEEDDNITSVSDAIFFCCHKVEVFTCSDSKMPLLDVTNTKPLR
ncbi:unnamed protein product [Cylicostephanus goldi]|uniref:BPTI/Kunitz inhibitor domain-containing protein n=1 Tax=Cylicostephanus goldi TaxID=71465 RepID=A0A3P7MDW7_CYLGO|nr:unnamed protein product [Cylicostephanus goldi]